MAGDRLVVTAILGGLAAALCWACSALCATAASRAIGAGSTLAWIMTLGLAIVAIPLALFASAGELTVRIGQLLAVSGVTNVIGLTFEYRAFKIGKVGVITAIASTEGMAATLIAVVGGAALSVAVFLVLLVITVGVVLAAADRSATLHNEHGELRRLVSLALTVPLWFGVSLWAAGEAGPHVSLLWAILPSRLAGAALIGAPMLWRGGLRMERAVLPLVTVAAACEVLGFAAYVWGSRSQLSVAAVLAAEYAALATAGAFFVLGERLARRQLAGLVVVAVGVGVLAVVSGG